MKGREENLFILLLHLTFFNHGGHLRFNSRATTGQDGNVIILEEPLEPKKLSEKNIFSIYYSAASHRTETKDDFPNYRQIGFSLSI